MPFDDLSETELAFSLRGSESIQDHSLFKPIPARHERLVSVYFDTPSRALENSGWTVRLRANGEQRIQTVKGPTVSVTRPEWNLELDCNRDKLDLDKLQVTPVWPIIGQNAPSLVSVFKTEVDRAVRELRYENTQIETAIDHGVIHSTTGDNRSMPINDLELELKNGGDIGAMFRMGIQLVFDAGVVMQAASKAERGYQLVNGTQPSVYKHLGVDLVQGTPTILAFRQLLADVLTHLRRNIAAARVGDPNGVHQVRVGIRRLRALLTLFRPILHRETIASFEHELQFFGKAFGEARDWDVFLFDTLPTASKAMPSSGWLNLVQRVALDKQAETHAGLVREIDSARFNSLILSLLGWAEDYPVTAAPRRIYQRPIGEVMPDLLSTVAGKMIKRRTKATRTPETMHEFRKQMKKLRYAVEFSESLFPAKAVRRFLRPCKAVQEALGGFNDVSVTRNLLATLTASYPAVTPAIRELSFWLDERERQAVLPVPKLLTKLDPDKAFW